MATRSTSGACVWSFVSVGSSISPASKAPWAPSANRCGSNLISPPTAICSPLAETVPIAPVNSNACLGFSGASSRNASTSSTEANPSSAAAPVGVSRNASTSSTDPNAGCTGGNGSSSSPPSGCGNGGSTADCESSSACASGSIYPGSGPGNVGGAISPEFGPSCGITTEDSGARSSCGSNTGPSSRIAARDNSSCRWFSSSGSSRGPSRKASASSGELNLRAATAMHSYRTPINICRACSLVSCPAW